MSNRQVIKRVFEEEFDSKKMKQQILLKYEKREKIRMYKIMKYIIIPTCFVLIVTIGILLNKEKENSIGTMKVYAYTMSENEKLEKRELKDNVKLGLASYNLALSSVPGYPIMFETDNVDYLEIDITNGTILDWDRETGKVKSLGSTYQLFGNGNLYFHISGNTSIKITGMKDKKMVFEKNIKISSDNDFNYYATIE